MLTVIVRYRYWYYHILVNGHNYSNIPFTGILYDITIGKGHSDLFRHYSDTKVSSLYFTVPGILGTIE